MIAREAAKRGETEKAFDALRKTVSYWSNPLFTYDKYWENDRYWGNLSETEEFQRIFEEKRKRIGPVYGMLPYFPGW